MRMRITVGRDDGRSDLAMTTESDAPVSEILPLLIGAPQDQQPLAYLGADVLTPGTTVGESGIHDGAIIQIGRPGPIIRDQAARGIEARVVGGPSAGQVVRFGPGRHLIGRHASCTISLNDGDVSREHAAIELSSGGELTVMDLGSTNGTLVEGDSITEHPTLLEPGQIIRVGQSFLQIAAVEAPDTSLTADGEGGFVFNRRYRIRQSPQQVKIEMPRKSAPMDKPSFPWVMAIAPLVVAGGMAAFLGNAQFLLLAIMSPIMTVGSTMTDRHNRKKRAARDEASYQDALQKANATIDQGLTDERLLLRFSAPDPALVVLTALGPRDRLWERRATDADHLLVRVGLGAPEAQLVVTNDGESPPQAWATPINVPLAKTGVLGVAAPPDVARGMVRAMLLQLSVLHSPDDVRVVLLTDETAEDDWRWIEWLPHAQLDPARGLIAIGNTPETVAQRLREIQQQISSRPPKGNKTSASPDLSGPADTVVIVDGASRLRGLPGMLTLLQQGPAVGMYSICIDSGRELLPEECGAVVVRDVDSLAVEVALPGSTPERDVIPDQVTPELAEAAARAMAPIHRTGGDTVGSIPSSARLLETLALDPPTAQAIRDRWGAGGSRGGVIGLTATGQLALDLATDGPHGLVAGTTGAGKSELLQSVVCALSVSNSPEDLNFVLVDYKGGAAFRGFLTLPHTVGMVTDLDSHLTERALRSLRAELKRREHQLGQAGAKDINDYREARARSSIPIPPMPRLAIVIDEFASLVEELPDFIKGLVGIAQLGRALGVHLILATQRPTGVVSPEIRANANFAIALRVVNSAESSDVIGSSLASTISPSTPGRAYMRISQEQPVAFQTARVGGRRPGAAEGRSPSTARAFDWATLGIAEPLPPRASVAEDTATDLHALVEALHDAAEQSGIPTQRQPWLDPLPTVVVLDDIDALPTPSAGVPLIPIGVEDLPDLQLQRPATIDLTQGKHLMAAGSPRSGRSSFLRTTAASIGRLCSPEDVHIFALDFGNGALAGLEALAHCGVVVPRAQPDRAERLLARLNAEVDRRHSELVRLGVSSATEQRQQAASGNGEPWPYLVVLMDSWEGFTDIFRDLKDGVIEQQFLRLLSDGGAVGMTVVIAGDRNLLNTSRIASLIEDKLVLRFNDRDDYSLAGLNPRSMPTDVPAGRAFRAGSGDEVQLALLSEDPSGPAQSEALARIVAQHAQDPRSTASRPFRVDALPNRILLAEAISLAPSSPTVLSIVAGVGGDDLAPHWIDLADTGSSFVVAGSPQSGRSASLVTFAHTLLGQGTRVIALAPRVSPLRSLNQEGGRVVVLAGADARSPDLSQYLNEPGPIAVLVDDAEDVDPDNPSVASLLNANSGDRALVIAGAVEDIRDAFRGFLVQARKSGTGVLLSPKSHLDAGAFGASLPRGSAFNGPPGRAHLFVRGRYTGLVQLPVSEPT